MKCSIILAVAVAVLLFAQTALSGPNSVQSMNGESVATESINDISHGDGDTFHNYTVASITNYCKSVDSELTRYDKRTMDLPDESTEGAELTFYSSGGTVYKISADHYFETGRAVSEYFYDSSGLCFFRLCAMRYNRPIYWDEEHAKDFGDNEVFDASKTTSETFEYYFVSGRVIAAYDGDGNEFDPSEEEILDIINGSKRYLSLYNKGE